MFNFPFSLTNAVDPSKFASLWPIYFNAVHSAAKQDLPAKPTKLWDLPSIHGIYACRPVMLEMSISPSQASSYGTRLSLVETILTEPDLHSRFADWIDTSSGTPQPTQALLNAVAVSKVKNKFPMGIMLDFYQLENTLKAESHV